MTVDPDGAAAVSGQGYVHLPASVRRAAGIVPGERVLLAAEPGRGTLLVYPLAVVDSMITERQARLAGGERA